jgi:predicted nucleotidyltransferase
MKKQFWEDWKRKSKLELEAIKNLKQTIRSIVKEAPKEEILSVYVKGSFVRREMNKKSDVDVVLVLKTKEYLEKLRKLKKPLGALRPSIHFGIRTYRELTSGKRINPGNKAGSIGRFNSNLHSFRLIYGKPLDQSKLSCRSNESILKGMVRAFNKMFIPGYKRKELKFDEISKQVFFLVEPALKVQGKNPPHSFRGIANSVNDPNHIIHDTLKLRNSPTKDKKVRSAYIRKLQKYLKELEEKHKFDTE